MFKFTKIKKNKIYKISLFIIMIFIIFKFFNTPYNIYSLLMSNYEDRMIYEYGHCKNESWGFYNDINKKFNLKNESIKIINDEGFETLENLFNLKKENNRPEYLLILYYQSENSENIYNSKYSLINNYKTIYRYNNCYLMRIND